MNLRPATCLLRIEARSIGWLMRVSVVLAMAQMTLMADDHLFSGYAVYGIATGGTEEEQVRCEFVLRTTGETWELRSKWSESVVSFFTDDGTAQYYAVSEMPAPITNQFGVVQTRPAVNAATIGNRNMISSQPELVRTILFSLTESRLFDVGTAPFELPESLAQDVFSVEIERRTNGVRFPIWALFRVNEQKREARIREATAKNDTKNRDYLQNGLRAGQIWASYEAEFGARAGAEVPVRCEFQVSLPSGQSHHSRYFRVVVTNTIVTPPGLPVTPPPLALNTFVQDVRLGRTYGYYASNGNWLALSEVVTHGRELVRAGNTGLKVRTVFLWLLVGILLGPPAIFGFVQWSKNKKQKGKI